MTSFVIRARVLGALLPSLLLSAASSALTLGPGEFLTSSTFVAGPGIQAYHRIGSPLAGASGNSWNRVLGGYAAFVAGTTTLTHSDPLHVPFGESFEVRANLSTAGFVGVPDVKLHCREGGAAIVTTLDPFATPVDGTYPFRIPETVVGPCGTEYYLTTTIGSLTLSDPPIDAAAVPNQVPTRLSNYSPGAALSTEAGTYRMISFAAQLSPATIAGTLEDDLGPWNNTLWRFGRYDPGLEDYREYEGDAAQTDALSAGHAFWLISRDPKTLDLSGFSRTSVPTVAGYDGFQLTLKPGWNQIGNPFAFSIDLRQASVQVGELILPWESAVGIVFEPDPLREFDPVTETYSRSSILDPWTGYFLSNADSQNRDVVLIIPHRAMDRDSPERVEPYGPAVATGSRLVEDRRGDRPSERNRQSFLARASPASAPVPTSRFETGDIGHEGMQSKFQGGASWLLDVRATLRSQKQSVTVGLVRDAAPDLDRRDVLAPPMPPEGRLGLYVENELLPRGTRRMQRDVRSWTGDRIEGRWEIVAVGRDGGELWLNFVMIDDLPGDTMARVIDRETAEQIDLMEHSRFRLTLAPGPGGRRLVVLVGPEHFVDSQSAAAIPTSFEFALRPVRPNPVRSRAFVQFTLPSQRQARVRIYDVSGRLVRSLVQEEMSAGLHTVVWDLRSSGGGFAASGRYFVRLESGARAQVRPVTVLR